MILRAGQYEYRFPRPAMIMGILNVTPDSFSDGGRYFDAGAAADHAFQMEREGAEIIDIGGESTRPGAQPVPESEECRRVLPVIQRLAGKLAIPISIDTMKPAVARAALAAGASMVNDVAAHRNHPAMAEAVLGTGAAYVCMHMQGSPRTMQQAPTYQDVTAEVHSFLGQRMEQLTQWGIRLEHIVLDVGIGFGKALEHNLKLLRNLDRFTSWKRPLLLGVSRKSFMGHLLGLEVGERLPASLACACHAVAAGVHIIRTHDVAATVQAVRMIEGIRDSSGPPSPHGVNSVA